jgi:GTP-binding protein
MIVALIGRPNVGKSSLFNRLVKQRRSLVWDQSGVTRDRIRGEWKLDSGPVIEVWDMAGWGKVGLSFQNLPKAEQKKIDLLLFVVDGSTALTPEDEEVLTAARRSGRPFFVVLNKADKKTFETESSQIFSKVKTTTIEMSAESKTGLQELENAVEDWGRSKNLIADEVLPEAEIEEDESTGFEGDEQDGEESEKETKSSLDTQKTPRLLILGRPNVGKSSLMNAITKEAVSVVENEAGTTRDVVETALKIKNTPWILMDTAGVRKKSKIYGRKADPVEIFSVGKALKTIRSADIALLVVEANSDAQLTTQDKKLLHLVRESLTPSLLIINKWDLVRKEWLEKEYRQNIKDQLADLDFMPILFVSATSGYHVPKIFQLVQDLRKQNKKIATSRLNKWLQKTLLLKPPRVAKKGITSDHLRTRTTYLHIQYMTQTAVKPMTFQLFCNAPHAVAEDDKRFFTRKLREEFLLTGIPLKLVFRRKNEGQKRTFTPRSK